MTVSCRAVLLVALTCALPARAEPTALLVEFRHVELGHYLLTADPAEAAGLDLSRRAAWVRTGGEFSAWKSAGDAPGLQPVCRFFVPASTAQVLTADPAECAAFRAAPGWIDQGIAFYAAMPRAGACDAGATPVYAASRNAAPGVRTRR